MRCRILALLLSVPAAGCYAYTDASFDAVAPGSDVRIEVTPEARVRIREALATDQRSLRGHVRSVDGGALLLDVVSATRQVGFRFEPLTQTLRFERADVTHVQTRGLHRRRTGLALTAGGAVLGVVAFKALSGWTGGDTDAPPDGGTADSRIARPEFRISIPFR